ncbi:hypothetical protein BD309DRAFT_974375 [Dichomitus squalens]|nr:hypothetical protein BD309DRAFT_974375 [Dichomitus squalens]
MSRLLVMRRLALRSVLACTAPQDLQFIFVYSTTHGASMLARSHPARTHGQLSVITYLYRITILHKLAIGHDH